MAFDNRFVSIKKESTYGTKITTTPTYGEVDDESIRHQFDLLTRDDMSRYAAAKSVTGKEFSEGDVNFAMLNDAFLGTILGGIFPTDTVTGSGDPYTHTFTEAGTSGSYTLCVGRETKAHYYTGAVVNSLSVSASINEYAMVTAGFMAKAEDDADMVNIGTLTPTFPDALPALYFSNAQVFFDNAGSASEMVKSISFDINLNRDGDNACGLGSTTYTRAPPIQRREVTGTIEFNRVVHTAANSEPTYAGLIDEDGEEFGEGANANPGLRIQFGDDSTADLVQFDFKKIRFEAPEINVSGRDTQVMTVGFVALLNAEDTSAEEVMRVVMKTSDSAAYV